LLGESDNDDIFELVGVEDIFEEQELVVDELEDVDESEEPVDELYEQLEPEEILSDSIGSLLIIFFAELT